MNRTILLSAGLLFTQTGWAQLYNATPNQTQSLHDLVSIELGDGFFSSSGISITIDTPPNTFGQWATVNDWGTFIGIHTHVLPNGNVLSWQGHNDDQAMAMHTGTNAYIWNPTTSLPTLPSFHLSWTNAFCTGHSFLADGQLLVTGGHFGNIYKPGVNGKPPTAWYIQGLNHANTYDFRVPVPVPSASTLPGSTGWHREFDMTRNRWYPTNTTLSNGDVLTTAGETEPVPVLQDDQRFPELWHNGTWTELRGVLRPTSTNVSASGFLPFPTYPWTFAAPNGKVFYAGPDQAIGYIDPAGTSPPLTNGAPNRTGTWTPTGGQNRAYNGSRSQGTAAMFWPGRILLVGGSNGQTVTNTVEVIDLTSGANGNATNSTYLQPVITPAAPMRHARHHVNATLLPDGSVLVTGGSRITTSNDPNQGELEAEIWTPTATPNGPTGPGTWTTVAAMKEARMYHSTAALLPDGRVLSAGGEEVIKYDPFTPNLNNHCTAEIYSPPYLFDAAGNLRVRPTITGAPVHVGYGQPFTITASAGSGTLARATLVRLSSVTHSFNMNQRFLELAATFPNTNSLAVTAPGSGNDCPPGHYLLYVLNSNGTPSLGQVVHIGASACAASPTLSTSTSSGPDACSATATATVSGKSLGTDYRWTINGVPTPAYDGLRTATVTLSPCEPQATLGVSVTPSCGGARVENFVSVSRGFLPSHCPCGPEQ